MKRKERKLANSTDPYRLRPFRREERKRQFVSQGNMERRRFHNQINRKWRFTDVSFLTLRMQMPGSVKAIIVYFDVPITLKRVEERLDKAFGDL